MTAVQLIDYGAGNMFSIHRALESIGVQVRLVADSSELSPDVKHVVLPGVGAFEHGMSMLRSRGLDGALQDHVARDGFILGICLGAQLLFRSSEEFGSHHGLGLLAGVVTRIPQEAGLIPHVGWAATGLLAENHPVFRDLTAQPWFYFVHSFRFEPTGSTECIASVGIGGQDIAAAAAEGRIVGVQFHPERSGDQGLRLLSNFTSWGSEHA